MLRTEEAPQQGGTESEFVQRARLAFSQMADKHFVKDTTTYSYLSDVIQRCFH